MKTRAFNPFTICELRFTRHSNRRPRHLGKVATRMTAGGPSLFPNAQAATIAEIHNQPLAASDLVNLVLERALVLGCSALQHANAI